MGFFGRSKFPEFYYSKHPTLQLWKQVWRHSFFGDSYNYNILSLHCVYYYNVSGGRVSKEEHCTQPTSVFNKFKPSYGTFLIRLNALDWAKPSFIVNCVIFKSAAYVTVFIFFYKACTRNYHVILSSMTKCRIICVILECWIYYL